jgi:hypothetical protein
VDAPDTVEENCRGNEQEMVEAAPGFEPGMKVLQTSALPLGYAAVISSVARTQRKGTTGMP